MIATNMWRDGVREPLPRLSPGNPTEQIVSFELQLVERLCQDATSETAREVADMTWSLVDDREDDDVVKRAVVACHDSLVERFGPAGGLST